MDPVASLRVNAANGEQVLRLPPGAEVLLGSDDCPVGAYRIGATVFACQYHPEMSDGFIADLVAEHGSDLPQGARTGLSPPADRLLLLGWIARFFEQAAPRATRIIVQK